MTSFLSVFLVDDVMIRYNDIVGHPTEEVDLEEDIKDIETFENCRKRCRFMVALPQGAWYTVRVS